MKLGNAVLNSTVQFDPASELRNMTDTKLELVGDIEVITKSSYEDAEGNVTVFNRQFTAKPIVVLDGDGSVNEAVLDALANEESYTLSYAPNRITESRISGTGTVAA